MGTTSSLTIWCCMSNPSKSAKFARRLLKLSWPVWIVVAGFAIFQYQTPPQQPENFVLNNMATGQSVASSQFLGKVVYVDVWASWCVPCRESMPHAQMLADTYADAGLVVIGINQDTDMAAANAFLDRLNIRFMQLGDPRGEFMIAQEIAALPTVLIYDRLGVLRHRYVGYTQADRATIDAEVLLLLAE